MLPLKDNIPTERFPVVTVVLIVLNLAVFGWQLSFPTDRASSPGLERVRIAESDQNVIEFGTIPYRVTHPGRDCGAVGSGQGAEIVCEGSDAYRQAVARGDAPVGFNEAPALLTLLTSIFMHGGLLHIGGNMLFLWIFGNNVEDSTGRPRFLLFYLLAGLAADGAQIAFDPDSTVPTVGASGAVAGVLGAYLLLFPRARVLTAVLLIFFFTLIEIPAIVFLILWFALQFLPAVGQLATPDVVDEGGVAYFAHIGGFLFGLALIKAFANRRRTAWSPA